MRGLAAVVLALAAASARAQTLVDPHLQLQRIHDTNALLTGLAFIGEDDFLISLKNNGWVRRVTHGIVEPAPVVDLAVEAAGENGLLGIATDPDFDHNRYVYLYYSESSTGGDTNGVPGLGNRVYRYRWNGSALVEPKRILDLPLSGTNHNGGALTFGPDDALYLVIGDQNRFGKLQNLSFGPNPDDTGVIFRVDTEGRGLGDNPFYNRANPADPLNRYLAYGVRNSFGLDFDPRTGDLWDTENGPDFYDEINRVTPGFDSGWIRLMGPAARDAEGTTDLWITPGAAYSDPEFSWKVPVAPTAIAFVASRVMGCELEHTALVGDVNCGLLRRFRLDPTRTALAFSAPELADNVADNDADPCTTEQDELVFGSGFFVATDIENAPDGTLYVTSLAPNPSVIRIAPLAGSFPDADGDLVDNACDCAPGDVGAFAPPVEVPRLRVSGRSPLGLGWNAQRGTAGSGTKYAVVSGSLAALHSGGLATSCTLAANLALPRDDDTRAAPPAGDGYFYLVRASNSCAAATFGAGRTALDAALPPACPP
ncbi:MAG TPA: PQQ-dependent sugar dehydrogenase [Candidatus Polarisedimenticolaceae bacterium]|nr:PQQ-dependent sugar dehydrogenase [Candidatus Polarisedimenticolaceae bacterium]